MKFIIIFELDLMSLILLLQRAAYTVLQASQNLKIPILLQYLKHFH